MSSQNNNDFVSYVVKISAWDNWMTSDDVSALNDAVRGAREAFALGGAFVLQGDEEVPTESHRFRTREAFEAFLLGQNMARRSLGKAMLG